MEVIQVLERLAKLEPAALAETVRLLLAALVSLGWLAMEDVAVNSLVSAVAAMTSVVLTVFVRNHVTPVPGPEENRNDRLEGV